MDSLLNEYQLTKSKTASVQIKEYVQQHSDKITCLKALSAYTLIHKSRDFEQLVTELLNRIPSTQEIEMIVEKLLLVIKLDDLENWPSERQRIKYKILNGVALCSMDLEYLEHNEEETYFSTLLLDKLLKYFGILKDFHIYRKVVGKKLMESTEYWDYFRSFPFSEKYHSKTSLNQINRLYFEITSIDNVYTIETQIEKREELMRFYLILNEKYKQYPELRKHFEWFIFKHSITLSLPLEMDLHNWDFIFDRIEAQLHLSPEGPRMLEAALSKSNMPFMVSFIQPIIFDLLKKRHRSEDFYVLPLLRMLSKDKSEGFLNVLLNYASLDSLKIRETSLEMLLKLMREMQSIDRLPFVARTWDILVGRKDATCRYLKSLAELEGDFLESRIDKLSEDKKKLIHFK